MRFYPDRASQNPSFIQAGKGSLGTHQPGMALA